ICSFQYGSSYFLWINAQCKGVLDEPGLMEKLTKEKYDVMLVETFDMCGIALSHLIKPKSLITCAASVPIALQAAEFGLEPAFSYNPIPIVSHVDIHSFWSRAWNLYACIVYKLTWIASRTGIEDLFRERYGDEFPGLTEIASNAAYSFINTEPLIDLATPTLSRVIYVGGIGAREAQKLDKEFDEILSLRNKTVLISFGSVVASYTLPIQVKENFLKTISRYPDITFIWKYEKPDDEFAQAAIASTPNLRICKWTPQNDLLADDRLTAFITHGGMASTQETAKRGKPGLYIPFFGDQHRNSGTMEKNGLGKVFSKHDLFDAEKLFAAVKDLIENDSYRQNAVHTAAMIKKKPFSARDLMVKSVEFAAEFGPSPALRPQIYDMNWIEYSNADIIAVLLLFVILLVSF
ncbi:hypothetical protein PFISCL1PPCAC_27653, partial [Pristionchus fissidentatus]